MAAIQLAAPYPDPLGHLDSIPREALLIDEGLERDGPVGVAREPVAGKAAGGHGQQHLGAKILDSTQGRIRKRALLATRCRLLSRWPGSQPMKRSRGAIFQAAASKPSKARMRSCQRTK